MEFISVMEMIGTVAFAVSGALVAIEKKLDYYGIIFLAIITSVGGGIVRDMMINTRLPLALENPLYALISIASAIVVIAFYKGIVKYKNVMLLFDAIGLAAFTAIGAAAPLSDGVYTPFVVITVAILTGTGGGILRDVFTREIPLVFRKEVYAVASILGALVFLGAYHFWNREAAMYCTFGVTLAVRLLAVKMDWHLKKVKTADEGKDEGP